MASTKDDIEMEEEDFPLILNAEDGMEFDMGGNPVNHSKRADASITSSDVDKPLPEDSLLNMSFNSATTDSGEIVSPEEMDMLLTASPEKKYRPPVNGGEGRMVNILVPVTIAGGCVEVKNNDGTNKRGYYNHYFSSSLQMTKDMSLWDKVRNNNFSENEERPEILQIVLPSTDQLVKLYTSLHMYKNEFDGFSLSNVDPDFRLDCVLIRGVNGMSTQDMFFYLRTYYQIPVKLEWVNDTQCVAVFEDKFHAGRCILELSKPIDATSTTEPPPRDQLDTDFDLVDSIPLSWVKVPMPLSHTWRFTVASFHDTKKEPGFLLTYPKQSDKKQRNSEFFSDYYREYGNPHWNEPPSLWTKLGYQAKLLRKRQDIRFKKEFKQRETLLDRTSETYISTHNIRVPVKFRLGDSSRNYELSLSSFENKQSEAGVLKQEKNDDDLHNDKEPQTSLVGKRTSFDNDAGNRKRCWDGYRSGMVADAEEEFFRRKRPCGNSDDGSDRHRKPSISIKDRLGW